jgi:hypothetical protein
MTSLLSVAGFAMVPWHQNWKTPSLGGPAAKRGDEIEAWLAAQGRPDYVILDDDNDMLPEQHHRFVKTDSLDGFLWPAYERADRILKGAET